VIDYHKIKSNKMADHKTPLTSYHGGDVIGEGEQVHHYGAALPIAAAGGYPAIGGQAGNGAVAINMPAIGGVISRYNTNNNIRFYYGNGKQTIHSLFVALTFM
jgi:hypothetical protein